MKDRSVVDKDYSKMNLKQIPNLLFGVLKAFNNIKPYTKVTCCNNHNLY